MQRIRSHFHRCEATKPLAGCMVVLGRFFLHADFPVWLPPTHFTNQTSPFRLLKRAFGFDAWVPLLVCWPSPAASACGRVTAQNLAPGLICLSMNSVTLIFAQVLDRKRPHDGSIQMILFHENVSILARPANFSVSEAGPFSLDARRSR